MYKIYRDSLLENYTPSIVTRDMSIPLAVQDSSHKNMY